MGTTGSADKHRQELDLNTYRTPQHLPNSAHKVLLKSTRKGHIQLCVSAYLPRLLRRRVAEDAVAYVLRCLHAADADLHVSVIRLSSLKPGLYKLSKRQQVVVSYHDNEHHTFHLAAPALQVCRTTLGTYLPRRVR